MQTMSQSVRKAVSLLITLLLTFALFPPCSATPISDAFTYDANGNMINGSGFIFEYNDANQLVKIVNESNSSIVAEYFYDANGHRVKKIEGGVTNYYIGDYVETRVNGSNVDNTSYYFANNERVARKDPDSSKFYYHGDHLGSTSIVTNESGAQSEKVAYYPYGSLKERVGEGSTYLFTDQEFDDESGLYYYGARYYNPELTRFTQPDKITQNAYNPQSLNKYAYVLNNPLVYVDPTGYYTLSQEHREQIRAIAKKGAEKRMREIQKTISKIRSSSQFKSVTYTSTSKPKYASQAPDSSKAASVKLMSSDSYYAYGSGWYQYGTLPTDNKVDFSKFDLYTGEYQIHENKYYEKDFWEEYYSSDFYNVKPPEYSTVRPQEFRAITPITQDYDPFMDHLTDPSGNMRTDPFAVAAAVGYGVAAFVKGIFEIFMPAEEK